MLILQLFIFQLFTYSLLVGAFMVEDSILMCEDVSAIDFSNSCLSSHIRSDCKKSLESLKNYFKFRDHYIRLYIDGKLEIFHSIDGFILTTSCKLVMNFNVIESPKSCNEDVEISIQNPDGSTELAYITKDSIIVTEKF